MKHLLTPTCRHGCRFVQVTDELWLCPHAAYGSTSYMLGAVEEGRRLLDRAGGYDAVVSRVAEAEEKKRQERRDQRNRKRALLAQSVRYDKGGA